MNIYVRRGNLGWLIPLQQGFRVTLSPYPYAPWSFGKRIAAPWQDRGEPEATYHSMTSGTSGPTCTGPLAAPKVNFVLQVLPDGSTQVLSVDQTGWELLTWTIPFTLW